jgi:hypothetical protein
MTESSKKETGATIADLQADLQTGSVDRRSFIRRLSVLGLGIGVTYTMGIKDASARAALVFSSTEPAIDVVVAEAQSLADTHGGTTGERYSQCCCRCGGNSVL